MDMDELELEENLLKGNIDVEQFGEGTSTIKNFTQEFQVGECLLEDNGTEMLRVVFVVQVKLYRDDDTELLVQKELIKADGTKSTGECLLAKKKRPYANPFHVAWDLISKDLRIPQHFVKIDQD